ncbi:putative DnaJ domain-containing protein [Helianthus annuus]|nr:putative DnaJ domain-containing protein [Helianthus annuus]
MLTIDYGWKKGCTDVELKNAYKKLSLRWNPDCCSELGNLNMWKKQRISFRQYKKPILVINVFGFVNKGVILNDLVVLKFLFIMFTDICVNKLFTCNFVFHN